MPENFDKDLAQHDVADRALDLDVNEGDIFRHYKGGYYIIVAFAVKEDTGEPLVVYRSNRKKTTWVRTFDNFFGIVEVDGDQVQRFEKVYE
jgi:hypothetical protein